MKREQWFFPDAERYALDFGECSHTKGFSQVDTGQDAWYFGTWANPFKMIIVNLCEGDLTKTACESEAEFAEELRKIERWNRENDYWRGIDTMCDDDMTRRFIDLGLGDLLHPGLADALTGEQGEVTQ